MKKRRLVFLVFVFLFSLFLVSCKKDNHGAGNTWLSDDTNHWHECVDSECDELFDKAQHEWSEWTTVKKATCKQAGENTRSCKVCGKEETETVNKLTHSDSSYVEAFDNDYHWLECPTCKQVKENSKEEHTFNGYVSNNDATCEANGTETAKCTSCSKTHTREVADTMLEHVFSNYVSDNNATCEANGTETSKCNTCNETHTREVANSILEHEVNKDVWQSDDEAHWHQCENCTYTEDLVEHEVAEWNIETTPTFDDEGLKTGHCSACGKDAEVVIPTLIKAEYLALNVSSLTLHVGETFELVATIGPASAENYRVEWLIDNQGVITLTPDGNSCSIAAGQTIGRVVVTLKVINELDGVDLYEYSVDCTINVNAQPIVKYSFDNGEIANTGTQSTVNGRATTNNSNKLVVDIDNSLLSKVAGVDGVEGSAIELNNKNIGGNHFAISNIETITDDFTISVKVYLNQATTVTNYANYLFGTSTNDIFADEWKNNKNDFPGKDPIAPLFNFAYASNQGRMQIRWYINGKSNSLKYIPVAEWVEIRMVKHGTTVTVFIDNIADFDGDKLENYSYSVTLDSADQLVLSPDFILGFASNACVQDPGNAYVRFDDILIYDYATGHMFGEYHSNEDASCTQNGTETAKCLDCEVEDTREIANSKLPHTLTFVPEKVGSCSESGNIAHHHCSECGKNFDEEENELLDVSVGGSHNFIESYYELQEGVVKFVEICSEGHVISSEVDTTKPVEVNNYNDLVTLLEAGLDVVLTADIDLTPEADALITGLIISKDVTIDLAEYKLTYNVALDEELTATQNALLTVDGGNVVIKNGSIESLAYGLYLKNGSLTLEAMTVKANVTAVKVYNGTLDILSGNYLVEDDKHAHAYTIDADDESYKAGTAIINVKGGKFENFNPANNTAEGENTNFVPTEYELMAKGTAYLVTRAPIARFTFEDGLVNTGTDSTIRGVGLSNANGNRYEEVDMSNNLYTTHTQGTTVYQLGTTALQVAHSSNGNSFGIKGIDTGTGDFTISVKIYTPYDFIKQSNAADFDTKNWSWYLFGTAYENSLNRPVAPCFDVRLGKENNGAGWFISKVKLNNEEKPLYVKDQAGFWQGRKWIEFRIVKEGTTVTISQVYDAYSTVKGQPYSISYELSSVEDLMITPDMVLGFGCNYGVNRPGAFTYYDDIVIYDYAVPFID